MTVSYWNDEEFARWGYSFAMGISDICFYTLRNSTHKKRKLRGLWDFFYVLSHTLAIFLENLGIIPYDLHFLVRENNYYSADGSPKKSTPLLVIYTWISERKMPPVRNTHTLWYKCHTNVTKFGSRHKGLCFPVQVQSNPAELIIASTQPTHFKRLTCYTQQHIEINGITYINALSHETCKTQSCHDFITISAVQGKLVSQVCL